MADDGRGRKYMKNGRDYLSEKGTKSGENMIFSKSFSFINVTASLLKMSHAPIFIFSNLTASLLSPLKNSRYKKS
jgi:hypothetical protein